MRYTPGRSFAHRLDPRSKLAVQVGFATAAFAHTTSTGLVVLSGVTLGILWSAHLSPRSAFRDIRIALPFLIAGPMVAGVTLESPWFSPAEAIPPVRSSYRVLLILLVSAGYVRTTPVPDSRAAIQWLVPGRAGQFLGMSVAIVFRFLPVLVGDLKTGLAAMKARLGDERPVTARIQLVAAAGLGRAFARADRFSLALRARLFAWNPTLPPLRFERPDAVAVVVAIGLVLSTIL